MANTINVSVSVSTAANIIEKEVVEGSLTGTLIDRYEIESSDNKKCVMLVFDKHYYRAGNRLTLTDYLKGPYEIDSVDNLLRYLKNGVNDGESGFTTAYFFDYKEARALMNSFGLKELAFVGIENILASKESDIYKLDESQYPKWLEICYQLGKGENLMGTSEHYLYIGRKELIHQE